MALTKIEGTSWYQGKDPVDNYIDQFQELIDLAEYDDDKTIVIKFQRGLDPALQNQVALLGDGAPDFGDLEGWYEAARRVFQNKEANKAFIEMSRGVTCNHTPTPLATKFRGVFIPMCKVLLTAPTQNPIPQPLENGPALMDIDCTHQRGNHTTVCLQCQQPGHYVHECPQAFDIRSMTMEEKLELLPELLTLADLSKETTSEETSEQVDPGASEDKDVSYFVACSR